MNTKLLFDGKNKYRVTVKVDGYPDHTVDVRADRASLANTRAMFSYPHKLAGQLVTYKTERIRMTPDGFKAVVKANGELWIGVVPEIFGYGMTVLATSEAGAMKALKAEYRRWKKSMGEHADPTTTFKGSFENFGGHVKRIEVGKVYYDNFGE